MWPLLERLGQLKTSSPALHGGKKAASYERLDSGNSNVLTFQRAKEGQTVTFVGNFSDENQSISNPSQGALNYFSQTIQSSEIINLEPWGFKILLDK